MYAEVWYVIEAGKERAEDGTQCICGIDPSDAPTDVAPSVDKDSVEKGKCCAHQKSRNKDDRNNDNKGDHLDIQECGTQPVKEFHEKDRQGVGKKEEQQGREENARLDNAKAEIESLYLIDEKFHAQASC